MLGRLMPSAVFFQRRNCVRSIWFALLLCLSCGLAAPAAAQCPKGYFRVDSGENAIRNTDAAFNATGCVLVRTTASEILSRFRIIARVTNVATLQDTLQSQLLSGQGRGFQCGTSRGWLSRLVPGIQDLALTELRLSFVRSASISSLHAVATIKGTGFVRGVESFLVGKITADAKLAISQSGDELRFAVQGVKVKTSLPFGVNVSQAMTDCVNGVLAGYPVNPYKYISSTSLHPIYRATAPTIDLATLVIANNQLSLRIDVSARLPKAEADRMLRNATSGWAIEDIVDMFKAPRAGPARTWM
jgi:hypothetical protein